MSGHSKWKNIKDRKGAQDAKKGQAFTKIIKEIAVAVKTGGVDAEANPRLRSALLSARSVNMPKDNIDRAIKKASGADADSLQEITYEGYGPGGVAIFVECTTDNNVRTISNVRACFSKYGGSVGKDGCLQFVFARKGVFTLPIGKIDEDDWTMSMIDAGAEDVEFDRDTSGEIEGGGTITVTTAMEDFGKVQKKFAEMGIEPKESGLQRIPSDTKKVDTRSFETLMKLIEKLEEDDDVQKVYHNIEYSEELANYCK
ncbi:MAG: YebC/PmpR family DNA-binding transcriptional regulator [Oligoflexia bacterium]|nr:YebC/PmpR family DNA-binding transcriptional regulator [Oligoflexia bacterium]